MPVNAMGFPEGALCVGVKALRGTTLVLSALVKVQTRDREGMKDVAH